LYSFCIVDRLKQDKGYLMKALKAYQMQYQILFRNSEPIPAKEIANSVKNFGRSYDRMVRRIIKDSTILNEDTFKNNAFNLLRSFKMVRSDRFVDIRINMGKIEDSKGKLKDCWEAAKEELHFVRTLLNNQKIEPRTRTLLLLDEETKKRIFPHLWSAFNKLLTITMGKHSYGLLGASKILFSAFPEIVLPVDNPEWLSVFKSVDLGDVINLMAEEIKKWEEETGEYLDHCDSKFELTLPAIYNVMAMEARPLT